MIFLSVGDKGNKGILGDKGDVGFIGAKGIIGEQGIQGPVGNRVKYDIISRRNQECIDY